MAWFVVGTGCGAVRVANSILGNSLFRNAELELIYEG
jgi:hypothetical protein